MSHNHGGGGGGMGGGMMMGTALFQVTNIHLAQSFWYIIAGVVGFLGIIRGLNYLEGLRRLRRRRSGSVQFPTRPSNRITQIWATTTALVREAGHPQLYIPIRGLRWATPPPLGRVLVLLAYWAVIIYMMVEDAIVKDAYYWERIGFRNAWVTLMQMPLVYLLAMKVNVVGLIVGVSHERLNWLHRWVARTMFVTATVHGFHFWTEWVRADFVETQLRILPAIKYGLGAWGLLVWTFLTGMQPLRAMAYELFVAQHILSAVIFLWLVYVHIPVYAQQYLWLTIALICFDRLARWAILAWQNTRLRRTKGSSSPSSSSTTTCEGVRRLGHEVYLRAVGSSTTVVTIKDVHFSWKAGQYLYLWLPRVGFFEAHPYTIACAHQVPDTCVCNSIQLVVRAHGGFSKRLYRHALKNATAASSSSSSSSGAAKGAALTGFVTGPFGAPPRWDIYETMVLISASTGASFTLPILESVVQSRGGTTCVTRIEFVLMACQGDEVEFYTQRLRGSMERAQRAGIELVVHIAITRSGKAREGEAARMVLLCSDDGEKTGSGISSSLSSSSSSSSAQKHQQHRRVVSEDSVDGGCCQEKGGLDLEKGGDEALLTSRTRSGSLAGMMREYYCRPDLEELIRGPVEASGGETSVVVCGGPSLTSSVRNCVAALSDERAVHKGTGAQGIHLFVEEYSF
ncbi:Putative ferric reductase, NAD binding domain, ferric reductase transmembrane component-like protein [Colletotrichum destructivum]|uniref:ferric-chelate reductase (NADPH) n=1 Tax=Colletotrichum destructivum TaxID=34406 RepID=A0AAX4HZZ0_9PEZI|nr:Putative ferric reductase, NAD binding domain, ferric reductase transmembrane component-like protein [Colletotrichum destructivum]